MPTAPNPFFSWDESYLLHNQVVDGQHRHLVGLVTGLYESILANEPKDSRIQRLTILYNFAKTHYATEEQILRLHRYPKYLFHKAAHGGLIHALLGLREQIASGDREFTLEYVELIKLWLIEHFNEFDRKCEEYLSGANLQAPNDSSQKHDP